MILDNLGKVLPLSPIKKQRKLLLIQALKNRRKSIYNDPVMDSSEKRKRLRNISDGLMNAMLGISARELFDMPE